MANNTSVKPIVAAVGAAFIAGMATAPLATAAENPFAASELSSGYSQQLAEGKCGCTDIVFTIYHNKTRIQRIQQLHRPMKVGKLECHSGHCKSSI